MSSFERIAEQAAQPDADFEAFFAECERHVPNLAGDSRFMPRQSRDGFKSALRMAFAAGKLAQAEQIADAHPDQPFNL